MVKKKNKNNKSIFYLDGIKHETWLDRRYESEELIKMPAEQRDKIIKEQCRLALLDYEVIPDGFDIVDDD